MPSPSFPPPAAKPRRSKISAWYYSLAILPIIVGTVLLFYSFAGFGKAAVGSVGAPESMEAFKKAFKFDPIAAPGTQDITLEEAGTFVIFYEYQVQQTGPIYTFSTKNVSGLNMSLKSKDGKEIALTNPPSTFTYNIGNRRGTSLKEFTVDKAGVYEFSSWYAEGREGGPVTLSVGRGFRGFDTKEGKQIAGAFKKTAAKALTIIFGSGVAVLGVVLGVFLLRRREKKNV